MEYCFILPSRSSLLPSAANQVVFNLPFIRFRTRWSVLGDNPIVIFVETYNHFRWMLAFHKDMRVFDLANAPICGSACVFQRPRRTLKPNSASNQKVQEQSLGTSIVNLLILLDIQWISKIYFIALIRLIYVVHYIVWVYKPRVFYWGARHMST
jgi:hypothetical protein